MVLALKMGSPVYFRNKTSSTGNLTSGIPNGLFKTILQKSSKGLDFFQGGRKAKCQNSTEKKPEQILLLRSVYRLLLKKKTKAHISVGHVKQGLSELIHS